MEAKVMIANSFDEFVEKVTQAERAVLNTPFGQEITQKLLEMKLAANPNMTPEEWQDTKSQFLTFLFAMFVKETPEAMAELALLGRTASKGSIKHTGGAAAAQNIERNGEEWLI